jgi:hypothetical protein
MTSSEEPFAEALAAFRSSPLGQEVFAPAEFTKSQWPHVKGCTEFNYGDEPEYELRAPEEVESDFMSGCCDMARPGTSLAGLIGQAARTLGSKRVRSLHQYELVVEALEELSSSFLRRRPGVVGADELSLLVSLVKECFETRREHWHEAHGEAGLYALAARALTLLGLGGDAKRRFLSNEFNDHDVEQGTFPLSPEELRAVQELMAQEGFLLVVAPDGGFFGGGFYDLHPTTGLLTETLRQRHEQSQLVGVIPQGLLPLVDLANRGKLPEHLFVTEPFGEGDEPVLETVLRLLADGREDVTEVLEVARALA